MLANWQKDILSNWVHSCGVILNVKKEKERHPSHSMQKMTPYHSHNHNHYAMQTNQVWYEV